MKNKIFKALFLIIMVFSLSICSDVRADDLTGEAENDTGHSWGSTDKSSNWAGGDFEGIRITIVDSKGKRVANTVSADYFSMYDIYHNQSLKQCWVEKTVNSKTIQTNYNKYAATAGMRNEVNSSLTMYGNTFVFKTLDFYPYYGIMDECPWASEVKSGNYFEKYFMNMDKTKLYSILSDLTGNKINEYLPTSKICGGELYFVIEPLTRINFQTATDVWSSYVGTVTELAHVYQNRGAPGGLTTFFPDIAYSIYMKEKFPGFYGFSYVGSKKSISLGDILNKEKGYALGVFKLSDIAKCSATCWTVDKVCGTPSCDNTDKQNEVKCYDQKRTWECEYDEVDSDFNSAGKKTFDINTDCSLYCTEEATVSYPGNIGDAISIYTPFAWPTTVDGKYPLTTTATLTCKPMMHDGSEANGVCLSNLAAMDKSNFKYVNSTTTAQVTYEYYQYKDPLKSDLEQKCTPTSVTVTGNTYKITSSCTYTLPTEYNVAIDKENGVLKNIERHASVYTDVQINQILLNNGGVLPESGFTWKDSESKFKTIYDVINGVTFGKPYPLKIENLPLGHEGSFTGILDDHEYECKYNITTDTTGKCACPPESKYNGLDITPQMAGQVKTCLDAQRLYCNELPFCVKADGTKVTTEYATCIENDSEDYCTNKYCPKYCPPGTTYAGETYEDKNKYKVCKASGGTDEKCIELACNCGTNCYHYCPPGTPKAGNDITDCVVSEQAKGNKLATAQKTCQKVYCYDSSGNGNGNIIYRTISLENPFPSKDADLNVNQSGLSKGMFNTTIKGRYPGTNWNSVTIVREKILNNRGYNGSEIYQKAKPLYVIELDPTAIKKIRDYNKKQEDNGGYSDFTLNCTSGAYCISSFIRSGITTADGTNMLTGGTCATANNKKTFINCYNK